MKSDTISADFLLAFEDKLCFAARPDLSVTVVGEGGKVFHRRAIKKHPDGSESRVAMLVAELDGVRMYFVDGKIVLTKEDLYL